MNLQTPVIIPKATFDVSHHSKMLLMGSCFSENIGKKLEDNKFSVHVNPFGIMYNPISIYNAMNRLLDNETFTEMDFIHHNHLYHSLMHHGSFSKSNLDDAVEHVNNELYYASNQLNNADVLLITFGTSYVFRWNESGEVVGNCHKIPANRFTRERLSVESICSAWSTLIKRVIAHNPSIKILFTVSPIRHFKDGAHENQLSKATLHLSIDKLMCDFPDNVFYFPAYEIVMDELRDYRFYADDMLHPTILTQDYIWKRFGETYFSSETIKINTEWKKIHQALNHKPYNADSKEYREFLQRTFSDLKAFEDKYTFFSCSHEKRYLTQLLKNHSIEY